MSFGAPVVDNFGKIQQFPSLSQLTGMLGNALGFCHDDHIQLNELQNRLEYTVCCLRAGEKITDYQTVDLGQEFMVDTGWTTYGVVEKRGGASSKATHIRYRDYFADACYLIGVGLKIEDNLFSINKIAKAVDKPARPLFIGRKTCIPSTFVYEMVIEATSTADGLQAYISDELAAVGSFSIWSSEESYGVHALEEFLVTDSRDWQNQIHVGQRKMYYGLLKLGEAQ